MKELLECLERWLQAQQDDTNAREICQALASESKKRVGSPEARQAWFDVLQIAPATVSGAAHGDNFDAANRWFKRADPQRYLDSRRIPLEAHFRNHGHTQALALGKTPSAGKHRTQWFYVPYDLPEIGDERDGDRAPEMEEAQSPASANSTATTSTLTYELTEPDGIRLNGLGRLLAGSGEFRTRSWRGLLWALFLILGATLVGAIALMFWLMHGVNRPVTTGDLVLLIGLVATGFVCWWFLVRPLVVLLHDRIVPASEFFTEFREDPCQLELSKANQGRAIRVVRYSGTCPICAGRIELEYGFGDQRRRLFGCCTEAPREHVFTFDRVTLQGRRVH